MNALRIASTRIMAACLIGMMIGEGPIIQKTFGLFIVPMSDELGWSRGSLSLLPALAAWSSVPLLPLIGRALDKWGPVRVLCPSLILFALANGLTAATNGSTIELCTLFIVLGAASAAPSVLTYATIITKSFETSRGLILGLILGGGGALGATFTPQIARILIEHLGWRGGRLGLSIIILSGAGFVVVLLARSRNAPRAAKSDTPDVRSGYYSESPSAVPRQLIFWMIIAAGSLTNTAFAGISVHLVPILTDRGLDLASATWILSVFGLTHLIGQMMAGWMLDKVNTPKIALPFFGMALVGLLLVHLATELPLLIVGAFAMGWGHGAELSAGAYFFARYFGVSSFGATYGIMVLFGSISAGLGPLLMGDVFDRTGSYNLAIVIFELALALSLVLIAALGPYRYAVDGLRGAAATPDRTAAA
jgi:cyanate permease